MSLFKKLQPLYCADRHEDIHTEIVAQVLKNSDELTLAWLRSIGVTTKEKARVDINPQKTFAKLSEHETDSRPDITIRIVADGTEELIFVESKLGSTQGYDQLLRYADHLAEVKQSRSLAKASLVYITRDFEAVKDPRPGVIFKVMRWYEFYRILKAHVNGDGLAKELKLFMEENRMSLGNQFRSTDLVALENFFSAKALMDETLDGEVSEKASKIFQAFYRVEVNYRGLRDRQRYTAYSLAPEVAECHVGYWFPQENPDKPVWVGVQLYSIPGASVRKEVIQAFRDLIAKSGGSWSGEDLDEENEWSVLSKGKSIQSFMGETDHVRAVKNYFLQLLDEVGKFSETYPNLFRITSTPTVETKAEP